MQVERSPVFLECLVAVHTEQVKPLLVINVALVACLLPRRSGESGIRRSILTKSETIGRHLETTTDIR